jgi:hypothetical protein
MYRFFKKNIGTVIEIVKLIIYTLKAFIKGTLKGRLFCFFTNRWKR